MKLHYFFILFAGIFLMSSCTQDQCSETRAYVRYDPVYVTLEEFRVAIQPEGPRVLTAPGKIYFYKDYILINEIREGIHVIDNTNPASPVNTMFIPIKGNIDMAVMNDVLYADAYTDLVIINLQNISQPTVLNRKNDVFSTHYHAGPSGLLSHYRETDITEHLDCNMENWGAPFFFRGDFAFVNSAEAFGNFSGSNSGSGGPSVGQGGSMARFTISKGHLYAIGNSELFSMPILNGGDVGTTVQSGLPWGIETIFPYKDYLFVGANNGLHIVDITEPTSPRHVSTFQHANACDPVVVQDDIAFVTLRSGTECLGFTNQLEVIDVKNILSPRLLHSYNMQNPHGLAVDGNHLFLCEGTHGLKTFDISDLSKINNRLLSHIRGFDAYDAIAIRGKSLLIIGKDGFRQYDYSDPSKLVLISTIPVIRT